MKYTISVDITENDLRELLSGNTFEWTFTTKEDKKCKCRCKSI